MVADLIRRLIIRNYIRFCTDEVITTLPLTNTKPQNTSEPKTTKIVMIAIKVKQKTENIVVSSIECVQLLILQINGFNSKVNHRKKLINKQCSF